MSKYDRFHGTPWDSMEHCYYCGHDYQPATSTHSCQEECKRCGKDIFENEGKYRLYGDTYCVKCGELPEMDDLFKKEFEGTK